MFLLMLLFLAAVSGLAQPANPQQNQTVPQMQVPLDLQKLSADLSAMYSPTLAAPTRQLSEAITAALNRKFVAVKEFKGIKWLLVCVTQGPASTRVVAINDSWGVIQTPDGYHLAEMVTWLEEQATVGVDSAEDVADRIIKKMREAHLPSPSGKPGPAPTQLPITRASFRGPLGGVSPPFSEIIFAKSGLGKAKYVRQEYTARGVVVYAMAFPDYYKMLQLDRTASPEQVWLSYHKLKFLAEKRKLRINRQKFFQMHHAYYVLSDEFLRQEYDMAYNHRPLWGIPWTVRRAAIPFLSGAIAAVLWYMAFFLFRR